MLPLSLCCFVRCDRVLGLEDIACSEALFMLLAPLSQPRVSLLHRSQKLTERSTHTIHTPCNLGSLPKASFKV